MPYTSTNDLPDSVKNHLPAHAQEVFKEAYNNAWEEYKKPNDRRGDDSHEETVMKVAWSAVKKAGYEKSDDGQWHKASK